MSTGGSAAGVSTVEIGGIICALVSDEQAGLAII